MNSKHPTNWISDVCAEDLGAAAEDSFVDAYGDHEKHTGVMTMLDERLEFPFQAKMIGHGVKVVSMNWPEKDEFGLDLIAETADGDRHRVDARSVAVLKPFPEGIEFLALYIDWRNRF